MILNLSILSFSFVGKVCLKHIFSFSFLFLNSTYVLPKLRRLKRKGEKTQNQQIS